MPRVARIRRAKPHTLTSARHLVRERTGQRHALRPARRDNTATVRLICSGSCVEQMKKRRRAAFSSTAG